MPQANQEDLKPPNAVLPGNLVSQSGTLHYAFHSISSHVLSSKEFYVSNILCVHAGRSAMGEYIVADGGHPLTHQGKQVVPRIRV